jgi:hypothetical protein
VIVVVSISGLLLLTALQQSGHLEEFMAAIASALDKHEGYTKQFAATIKTALWGLANIGTSEPGAALLEANGALAMIAEIAEFSSVLSIRGYFISFRVFVSYTV